MAKLGRNAPCRCGSKDKYKYCCLRKDEAQASKDRSETDSSAPTRFLFEAAKGDPIMNAIAFRDIGRQAQQWDHPVKGLLKYASALKQCGGDVHALPKKIRELYCLGLLGIALSTDTGLDWWTHVPIADPPDGMVMTLKEIRRGGKAGYMANMREVEVVEQRKKPEDLLGVIREKLTEYAYSPNTILVCLILTPALYDLRLLASQIMGIESTIKHVFVVFATAATRQGPQGPEPRYGMVQLLPVFNDMEFHIASYINDFEERYAKGQESRLMDGSKIFYGTANEEAFKRT